MSLEPGDDERFNALARQAYALQVGRCGVYADYVTALGTKPPTSWEEIPPLPIQAFKTGPVAAFPIEAAEKVFLSSGTGSGQASRHYVRSERLYRSVSEAAFTAAFGEGPFCLLAHLPGYDARGAQSSLLYMVDSLMQRFGETGSRFFLHDRTTLLQTAERADNAHRPIVLFGAAFGLLDLLDDGPLPLPADTIVVETGGMKTHRREITREQLHARLASGFALDRSQIHSEYGMCELLSQAYTRGGAAFFAPPWVRFRVLDPENAADPLPDGKPGLLAVFDLANLFTVSAILTEDLAISAGGAFEVLGRLHGAELRGCNFLIEPIAEP